MSAEIGKQILDAVKQYVAARASALGERIDGVASALRELQQTVTSLPAPQRGEKGEPGDAGEAPTDEQLRALIAPLIPAPAQGERGEKGEPGAPGADGRSPSPEEIRAVVAPLIPAPVPGAKGDTGERGEPGQRGERGQDGRTPSLEEVWAIVMPLIPAPIAGGKGDQGARGEKGEPGRAPTHEEISAAVAPLIPAPLPGARGEKGEPGERGRDGTDGRDALQLEILPSIEDAKSYPRGTYAKHAGGLWRAFEATVGMRGWECLIEGIAAESETLCDDGRTLTRRTVYTSGREFERSFSFAVVLDKGVYRAESKYAPGDAVTWAGSVWIAQRRESAAYGKPGTPGSGWRLAVKAGRDAR